MRSFPLLVVVAMLAVPALGACNQRSSASSDGSSATASSADGGKVTVANAGSTAPTINPKDFGTREFLKATPGVTHEPHPTLVQSKKHGLPAAALSKLTPQQETAAEKAAKAER